MKLKERREEAFLKIVGNINEMDKQKKQTESYAGPPPTHSLLLFLLCPRTLCYSDVQSSFLLLCSAVEAFCSPLIHALPRCLGASEWKLWIEVNFGGGRGGGRGRGSAMFGFIRGRRISDRAELVISS